MRSGILLYNIMKEFNKFGSVWEEQLLGMNVTFVRFAPLSSLKSCSILLSIRVCRLYHSSNRCCVLWRSSFWLDQLLFGLLTFVWQIINKSFAPSQCDRDPDTRDCHVLRRSFHNILTRSDQFWRSPLRKARTEIDSYSGLLKILCWTSHADYFNSSRYSLQKLNSSKFCDWS